MPTAGAAWCGLNFWRCRHAHCIVTSTGWAALSILAFTEAGLGRSLIGGDEQPVFLAVLGAAVLFEAVWRLARGSNSIGRAHRIPGCCRVLPRRLLRAAGQEVIVDWASYPEFASSSSAGPSSAMPNLDRP